MAVASWLGVDDFPALLNNTNTHNEADLISACPMYAAIAAVPKSLKMLHFQSAIDKVLSNQGEEHLVIILTPAMFTNFVSMKWH